MKLSDINNPCTVQFRTGRLNPSGKAFLSAEIVDIWSEWTVLTVWTF